MASVTSREKSAAPAASLTPAPHMELPAVESHPAEDFGHPRQSLTGVQVLAMGSYAPQQVVHNEDLAALGYDSQWILQRTGITERRRAAPHEATSDLALAAARDCLAHAQMSADAIDLLIVATMTPDSPIPATACRVANGLGIRGPAFDINAACAGFMYALTTGMQFIKAGTARTAMIIGADVMSRVSNPADHKTFPLFGDGAGAVLIGPGTAEQGLISYTIGADGSGADLLVIPAGGSREPHTAETLQARRDCLIMDGRPVFQWAVQVLRDSISSVLAGAQLSPADVDLVVLHQANMRIIDAATSRLGIPREKVFVNLDRYGNTSGGSIPLALAEAERAGRVHRGDHIVLSGFGAGLAWGTAVLKY